MVIGLVAYSLKIKERGSDSGTYENLDDVDGNDMLEFIRDFLIENKKHFSIENKKTFCINSVNVNSDDRIISGLLTSGESGIPAQIRNLNNIEKILYEKQENDSECIPLYYLFYLPTNTSGILLLEKFGIKSAKWILEKLLKKNFQDVFKNYVINIKPLPQKDLMDLYFENAGIKKLTLASYENIDLKDEDLYFNSGQQKEKNILYEVSIKLRKNMNMKFFRDKLKDVFIGKAEVNSISNLVKIENYVPDQVKITFNVNGKDKTVRLDQTDEINAIYDIDNLLNNKYNHPNYEQINPIAIDYLHDLLGE